MKSNIKRSSTDVYHLVDDLSDFDNLDKIKILKELQALKLKMI